jgi:hypothetical protein
MNLTTSSCPVTGGTFAVVDCDGATHEMIQQAAVPYLGDACTTHDVVNRSGRSVTFIEIELKG